MQQRQNVVPTKGQQFPPWLTGGLVALGLFLITNYIDSNKTTQAERENQKYEIIIEKYSDLAQGLHGLNDKFSEFLQTDSKWKMDMMLKAEDRWSLGQQRTFEESQRNTDKEQDKRIEAVQRELELLQLQLKKK